MIFSHPIKDYFQSSLIPVTLLAKKLWNTSLALKRWKVSLGMRGRSKQRQMRIELNCLGNVRIVFNSSTRY